MVERNAARTPEAVEEIKKNFREEAEAILKLMSEQSEINFNVNATVMTIRSQIDIFAFYKINFTRPYSEQVPGFQELENKGEQVSYSAQALRTWLKQTQGI
jgi:hypothetical protein